MLIHFMWVKIYLWLQFHESVFSAITVTSVFLSCSLFSWTILAFLIHSFPFFSYFYCVMESLLLCPFLLLPNFAVLLSWLWTWFYETMAFLLIFCTLPFLLNPTLPSLADSICSLVTINYTVPILLKCLSSWIKSSSDTQHIIIMHKIYIYIRNNMYVYIWNFSRICTFLIQSRFGYKQSVAFVSQKLECAISLENL